MAFLEGRSIAVAYGERSVIRNLDLSVAEGEFLSLLGPSGCGKTTLLRVIAGLTPAAQGSLSIAGANITHVSAHRRNFGMVFQNYALFPHLNVVENVAFGLRARRTPRHEALGTAKRMLDLVQLSDLAGRRVDALSGGEQQRVAIARALATRPRLLLLDEPFSSLDRKLRVELQVELRRLIHEVGVTTIFVTHDQSEAFALSDRIGVMRMGTIEQIDVPSALYNHPSSTFVLDFVGTASRLGGVVTELPNGVALVETPYGRLVIPEHFPLGTKVLIAIRPEHIAILDENAPAAQNEIVATVRDRVYLGGQVLLSFVTEAPNRLELIAPEPLAAGIAPASQLRLALPPPHLITLPAGS